MKQKWGTRRNPYYYHPWAQEKEYLQCTVLEEEEERGEAERGMNLNLCFSQSRGPEGSAKYASNPLILRNLYFCHCFISIQISEEVKIED